MGAFNVVRDVAACPRCGSETPVAAQFKYGDTWQHSYVPGDLLRWGGNDIGSPGQPRVVVDAIAEAPCPSCGFEGWDLYVFLENDRIDSVTTATGEYDFARAKATFIVLEPRGAPP